MSTAPWHEPPATIPGPSETLIEEVCGGIAIAEKDCGRVRVGGCFCGPWEAAHGRTRTAGPASGLGERPGALDGRAIARPKNLLAGGKPSVPGCSASPSAPSGEPLRRQRRGPMPRLRRIRRANRIIKSIRVLLAALNGERGIYRPASFAIREVGIHELGHCGPASHKGAPHSDGGL